MRNELNLWVIGGDMRQAKLAELLADDGHTVHAFALEQLGRLPGVLPEESLEGVALADCVVLPLPVAGEGTLLNAPLAAGRHPLALVLDALRPGQVICAGMVSPQTASMAADRGLTLHDYFRREELAVANAVPTAAVIGHGRGAYPLGAGQAAEKKKGGEGPWVRRNRENTGTAAPCGWRPTAGSPQRRRISSILCLPSGNFFSVTLRSIRSGRLWTCSRMRDCPGPRSGAGSGLRR